MENAFAATAKPFAGVVLCCTGVDHDERVCPRTGCVQTLSTDFVQTQLVTFAQQMGAVFKPDLRSDVTHMVVGSVLTPKYQVRLAISLNKADIMSSLPNIVLISKSWISNGSEMLMKNGFKERI